MSKIDNLMDWHFSPCKLLELPIDEERENYIRENVKGAVFSYVMPTPFISEVRLVATSDDVLENFLDLNLAVASSSEFLDFVSGKILDPSSTPLAHRYAGHQFGNWKNQLGDGRVILLGEYVSRHGERWELQLKGAGKTPYSRMDDGRAVLRSCIREFLACEAMANLGVPTCRAAALVVSDDLVERDPLRDGTVVQERAAIVLRVAESWFRIGSIEVLSRNEEYDALEQLVQFIIDEHYPKINEQTDSERYLEFFKNVCYQTVNLVIIWQCFGFTHGVLNTDNISLLGLTIDYGPYRFMDETDLNLVSNLSDGNERYSFGCQLRVMMWNLARFYDAFEPLLTEEQQSFCREFFQKLELFAREKFIQGMMLKLGIEDCYEPSIISNLMKMMDESGADFTMTFYQLGEVDVEDLMKPSVLEKYWSLEKLSNHTNFYLFAEDYKTLLDNLGISENDRKATMKAVNPRYVLRNWMLQEAIEKAEKNDFSDVKFLLEVMLKPFEIQEKAEERGYAKPPPKWACSLKISCSS